MKTFASLDPLSYCEPRITLPRRRKLVGEWQSGLETISGCAQRKLRLTLAPSSPPTFSFMIAQRP